MLGEKWEGDCTNLFCCQFYFLSSVNVSVFISCRCSFLSLLSVGLRNSVFSWRLSGMLKDVVSYVNWFLTLNIPVVDSFFSVFTHSIAGTE